MADWPHLFYAVPPFDHTTCNITFDYKKEAACPAAGNGSSIDLYNRMASYAHAILERCDCLSSITQQHFCVPRS